MALSKADLSENWRISYYFRDGKGEQNTPNKVMENRVLPEFWFDLPPFAKIIYTRQFVIEKKANFVGLYFDRLESPAEIFINDKVVYQHEGNQANFSVEITDYIQFNTKNQIKIITRPNGRDGRIRGRVDLLSNDQEISAPLAYHQQKSLDYPEWLSNSVIYELYVRAFSKSGDFQSVIQKLDYLQELGINCIWLMPIFPVGEKNRKGSQGSPYSIRDFKSVNPEYGDQRDLKELVKQAHVRDMKIILDIACNHTAWDNDLTDEHPEWFTRDHKDDIIHPPHTDWYDVADLDFNNPEVRKYMLDVLLYWIKNFDIDGYRMDVAEFIPLDFWENALEEMQKIKSDILMLAEGDHPQLHSKAFHLSYAWNTRQSLIRVLNYEQPLKAFQRVVEHEINIYPKNTLRMRFSENHDLERSLQVFGKEKSKQAALLSFTIPGVPMIYAGQEIGAKENPSLFDKDSIKWKQKDAQFIKFYQKLINLRRNYSAFAQGEIRFKTNSEDESVLTFLRSVDDEKFIIVANISDQPRLVNCMAGLSVRLKNFYKVLGNSRIYRVINGQVAVHIPAYGYGIYKI
ncbi:MAG TPA: alpha-amylase family glycosyl hydrolase [bacterium]|nr:alpha-amylase family glycosyl hydrolase [bacterium]